MNIQSFINNKCFWCPLISTSLLTLPLPLSSSCQYISATGYTPLMLTSMTGNPPYPTRRKRKIRNSKFASLRNRNLLWFVNMIRLFLDPCSSPSISGKLSFNIISPKTMAPKTISPTKKCSGEPSVFFFRGDCPKAIFLDPSPSPSLVRYYVPYWFFMNYWTYFLYKSYSILTTGLELEIS